MQCYDLLEEVKAVGTLRSVWEVGERCRTTVLLAINGDDDEETYGQDTIETIAIPMTIALFTL
jgi:hypothetical protein